MPSNYSVQSIASKISFETVLPVTYVDEEVRVGSGSKYKRYDIIDGKNPFDEADLLHPPPPSRDTLTSGRKEVAPMTEEVEEHTASRRRPRTGHEHHGEELGKTRRPGWAAAWFSSAHPFQRVTLADLETLAVYMLDDEDYEWCEQQNAHKQRSSADFLMQPEGIRSVFTLLEREYVLAACGAAYATFYGTVNAENAASLSALSGALPFASDAPATLASFKRGEEALHEVQRVRQVGEATRPLCALCNRPVYLAAAGAQAGEDSEKLDLPKAAAASRGGRGRGRGRGRAFRPRGPPPRARKAAAVAPRLSPSEALLSGGALPEEVFGFPCEHCGVWAHVHCWGLTASPPSPASWRCDACFFMEQHPRRVSTRCMLCDRSGGVLIAHVSFPPSPSPASAASLGISCSSGGAAASAALTEGSPLSSRRSGARSAAAAEPLAHASPPLTTWTPHAHRFPSGMDGLCHLLCALALPHVEVSAPHGAPPRLEDWTSSRAWRLFAYALANPVPGGTPVGPNLRMLTTPGAYFAPSPGKCWVVEAKRRSRSASPPFRADTAASAEVGGARGSSGAAPSAHAFGLEAGVSSAVGPGSPTRRSHKQRSSLCLFCHHQTGQCVRCSHPNCFETVHPSCAGEAGTVECYPTTQLASSLSPEGRSVVWRCGVLAYCETHYHSERAIAEAAERAAWQASVADALFQQRCGKGEAVVPAAREGAARAVGRPRRHPPSAVPVKQEALRQVCAAVRAYWRLKRRQRRWESCEHFRRIHLREWPVVSAALRPEIVKVSPTAVRLSPFLCLVPEWALWLVQHVEKELPIPDEEYEDVSAYRKKLINGSGGPRMRRRSGRVSGVYANNDGDESDADLRAEREDCLQGLKNFQSMTTLLARIAEAMRPQAQLRGKMVRDELSMLSLLCQWKEDPLVEDIAIPQQEV